MRTMWKEIAGLLAMAALAVAAILFLDGWVDLLAAAMLGFIAATLLFGGMIGFDATHSPGFGAPGARSSPQRKVAVFAGSATDARGGGNRPAKAWLSSCLSPLREAVSAAGVACARRAEQARATSAMAATSIGWKAFETAPVNAGASAQER
jgi:hypothetical protein